MENRLIQGLVEAEENDYEGDLKSYWQTAENDSRPKVSLVLRESKQLQFIDKF